MRQHSATVLGFALVCLSGCGPTSTPAPADYGSPDGREIAVVVEELNDTTASKVKGMFATGTALAKGDPNKYMKYHYELKGKPDVSGVSATAKVVISVNSSGEAKGEKDWSFVKEGEKWKIKSAPLP